MKSTPNAFQSHKRQQVCRLSKMSTFKCSSLITLCSGPRSALFVEQLRPEMLNHVFQSCCLLKEINRQLRCTYKENKRVSKMIKITSFCVCNSLEQYMMIKHILNVNNTHPISIHNFGKNV